MIVERASLDHLDEWATLRGALWPDDPVEHHREDATRLYLSGNDHAAAFICRNAGDVIGFAEATLRHDFVNGCETSPVVFLEGVYVHPDQRCKGVARRLVEAVAAWGRSLGCTEFASDALLDNAESHRFHEALGFREAERVVYFH